VKPNPQVNIVSAEFKADPFPMLASLRAHAPIFRTHLPDKNSRTLTLFGFLEVEAER
jgi:hypothetical protein